MCIIIAKPKGISLPNRSILKTCFDNNPDGAGYAVCQEKSIYIEKGFFQFENLYNRLLKNITTEKDALIHFRIATTGLVDKGNTHPFVITKNIAILRKREITTGKTAVAHNGILSDFGNHPKLSDTQEFIRDVLADPVIYDGLYNNKAIQAMITRYINTDKLAFINYRKGLLMMGKFIKDGGCFYSNDGYKPISNFWDTWEYEGGNQFWL